MANVRMTTANFPHPRGHTGAKQGDADSGGDHGGQFNVRVDSRAHQKPTTDGRGNRPTRQVIQKDDGDRQ